jgi:hypothetical protein
LIYEFLIAVLGEPSASTMYLYHFTGFILVVVLVLVTFKLVRSLFPW